VTRYVICYLFFVSAFDLILFIASRDTPVIPKLFMRFLYHDLSVSDSKFSQAYFV